ncbi:hypothetical protein L208DRAFT_1253219 [Tricholoma matsutake]|nr:hypothetical protein L208DRAFT_1253219 [Tricholoma matsutake 945]
MQGKFRVLSTPNACPVTPRNQLSTPSIFILLLTTGTFLSPGMLSNTSSSGSLCITESPRSCSCSNREVQVSR